METFGAEDCSMPLQNDPDDALTDQHDFVTQVKQLEPCALED